MNLKNTILAAAVAVAMPLAATAATVVSSTGNVTFDSTTLEGEIKLPGAVEFDIKFEASDEDTSGKIYFDVINTSDKRIKVDVFSYTINQGGDTYGFMKGVDLWIGGELNASYGAGINGSDTLLDGMLEANEQTFFSFNFRDVYGTTIAGNSVYPNIDFRIVATVVPLPAAGLMLIGALGGLGMMQRRRKS